MPVTFILFTTLLSVPASTPVVLFLYGNWNIFPTLSSLTAHNYSHCETWSGRREAETPFRTGHCRNCSPLRKLLNEQVSKSDDEHVSSILGMNHGQLKPVTLEWFGKSQLENVLFSGFPSPLKSTKHFWRGQWAIHYFNYETGLRHLNWKGSNAHKVWNVELLLTFGMSCELSSTVHLPRYLIGGARLQINSRI